MSDHSCCVPLANEPPLGAASRYVEHVFQPHCVIANCEAVKQSRISIIHAWIAKVNYELQVINYG